VTGARDWISRAHSVSESGGASLMIQGRPTPNASDASRSATRNATARRKPRFVADGVAVLAFMVDSLSLGGWIRSLGAFGLRSSSMTWIVRYSL